MKITIVQGAFFPVPTVMGGAVEKIWFSLGKEFARRGHQVVHISRSFKGFPAEEMIEGVRHVRVRGFNASANLLLLKFFDLLYSLRARNVLPEAEILITNTFWLPMIERDPKFGKVYVHVARYPKGQMKAYYRAARLQPVSTVIARAIVEQEPWSKDRIRIIPNFVEKIRDIGTPFCERSKTILYVGRIHPEKGIGLLLDAFNRVFQGGIKDWRLILVGPWQSHLGGGGEGYKTELQKKTESIKQYVDWAGPVFSEEKLAEHYREASLFIYPSLAEKGEAFGVAPLEAMSYGCVPLVSDLECFKDFIEDGKTGFVFDHRAQDPAGALAKKISELVNSKELLGAVSKNCDNKASEFSLQRVADMYLADFETLVKQ